MTSIAQSNSSRLGFPALITALCRARGVVSNSLTFERLSLVINLAYIRKNCWNPNDLTVSIRGARRVRARPADLPSTSATPTPASTSATPSVLAQIARGHIRSTHTSGGPILTSTCSRPLHSYTRDTRGPDHTSPDSEHFSSSYPSTSSDIWGGCSDTGHSGLVTGILNS